MVGAALLSTTFAVKMLHQAAFRVRDLLDTGDLDQMRANMSSLVSRDPSRLTAQQAGAAAVESVSENMSDSFIGPWLAFALFGLPGAVAYRAINTLDSMIGYHGSYEFLGKTAALLDDLVNLIPSRLTGIFIVAASVVLPGQNPKTSWRIMWRDHGLTESPNAGWPMSGMAGALGVQLEKVSDQGRLPLGRPGPPSAARRHHRGGAVHVPGSGPGPLSSLGLDPCQGVVLMVDRVSIALPAANPYFPGNFSSSLTLCIQEPKLISSTSGRRLGPPTVSGEMGAHQV